MWVLSNFIFFLANRSLAPWVQHIINHLYWSVQTCNGNGEELQERFLSVLHHIKNRHVFTGNKYYKKCDHKPYSREEEDERQWMHMGKPAHNVLKSIIQVPQLVKDMGKMNENVYTTYRHIGGESPP